MRPGAATRLGDCDPAPHGASRGRSRVGRTAVRGALLGAVLVLCSGPATTARAQRLAPQAAGWLPEPEAAAVVAGLRGLRVAGEELLAARSEQAVRHLVALGRPVYCGGDRGRFVALTFDDGPGPYTRLALRILRRAHAGATFFLVGRNLHRWPRAARAELALAALGDHTWSHPYLPALSRAQSLRQLAEAQTAIARASGAPVELFRPPYGAHDEVVDAQAHRRRMLEVLWSVDTRDSEGAPWYAIAAAVRRNLRPGAIVLMHENHGQTIEALRFRILPLLRRRGYDAVTVPQLLALDPPGPLELHGYCFGNRGVPPTPGDAPRRRQASRARA